MILFLRNVKTFLFLVLYYFMWLFSGNRIKNSCLNTEKRNENVVVSLTSFPGRIGIVWQTIITLLNQTYKPDKVELWLAKTQFINEKLPRNLLKLQKYGLEVCWTDDLKSYKKLLPALKKHPDSIIITVDDDAFYNRKMIEKLMCSYGEDRRAIHCHRITHVVKQGSTLKTDENKKEGSTSYNNMLVGLGGVLYPKNALASEVFNYNIAKKIAPTNDDIWFWFMSLKQGTKVCYVKKPYFCPNATFGSLKTEKLYEINHGNDSEFSKCLERMSVKYNECTKLI